MFFKAPNTLANPGLTRLSRAPPEQPPRPAVLSSPPLGQTSTLRLKPSIVIYELIPSQCVCCGTAGSHNNIVKQLSLSGTISEDNKPPHTGEGGGPEVGAVHWKSCIRGTRNAQLPQTLGDRGDVQPWRLTPRRLIHLPSLPHMPCKCVS